MPPIDLGLASLGIMSPDQQTRGCWSKGNRHSGGMPPSIVLASGPMGPTCCDAVGVADRAVVGPTCWDGVEEGASVAIEGDGGSVQAPAWQIRSPLQSLSLVQPLCSFLQPTAQTAPATRAANPTPRMRMGPMYTIAVGLR